MFHGVYMTFSFFQAILQRLYRENLVATVNEIGRKPPTFADASALANLVLDSGFTFSQGTIYFNRFKSVVSYDTSKIPVFSKDTVEGSDKLSVYDSLAAEVSRVNLFFSCLVLSVLVSYVEGICR